MLLEVRLEHLGAHDRRDGQSHDAGDENSSRQGESELAEERSGQTALETDRRVDHGQGDGHRNDRTDQFARAGDGRLERLHAFRQMPLDVFHHDNGVVDHDADAQDDGEQGEQIDGEPGDLHEEKGTDDGKRNGRDGHEHGA